MILSRPDCMKTVFKNLISFVLPVTVLVIVPLIIEKNIRIPGSVIFFISGMLVICIGLAIMIAAISGLISKGDGTLAPWSPTKKLVIRGIYAYSRNPMILGVLVVLLGESLSILSVKILEWASIFFVINSIWFIVYEEPVLEKKFGEDYRLYRKNVNRWMPGMKKKPFHDKD